MSRALSIVAALAIASPLAVVANGQTLPPIPDWQTDTSNCAWHWREGGRIGLWAETCAFNNVPWQVVWDEDRGAFVTRAGDAEIGIAVQAFDLPTGSGLAALSEILVEAGHLEAEAPCTWEAIALRPASRTMAFHVLTPSDPAALTPTDQGEVPDPFCGPYGASTHGLRYFITDLRLPDRAIFIEEGQERPLFDPSSITSLP